MARDPGPTNDEDLIPLLAALENPPRGRTPEDLASYRAELEKRDAELLKRMSLLTSSSNSSKPRLRIGELCFPLRAVEGVAGTLRIDGLSVSRFESLRHSPLHSPSATIEWQDGKNTTLKLGSFRRTLRLAASSEATSAAKLERFYNGDSTDGLVTLLVDESYRLFIRIVGTRTSP